MLAPFFPGAASAAAISTLLLGWVKDFVCMALHHVGAGWLLNMLLLIDIGIDVKLYIQDV